MLIQQRNTGRIASKTAQRGDTLIEVMFAISVFALIVVSSLALMNQGSATSRRAVEITTVRQQIDGQAETLRFLQSAYVQEYYSGISYNLTDAATSPAEEYYRIIQHIGTTPTSPSALGSTPCGTPPTRSFVLNSRLATVNLTSGIFQSPQTFAQVQYNTANQITSSRGIWIEGIRTATAASAGYIDFHIRGCWQAPGMSVPMNLGTIVRLYEPRG